MDSTGSTSTTPHTGSTTPHTNTNTTPHTSTTTPHTDSAIHSSVVGISATQACARGAAVISSGAVGSPATEMSTRDCRTVGGLSTNTSSTSSSSSSRRSSVSAAAAASTPSMPSTAAAAATTGQLPPSPSAAASHGRHRSFSKTASQLSHKLRQQQQAQQPSLPNVLQSLRAMDALYNGHFRKWVCDDANLPSSGPIIARIANEHGGLAHPLPNVVNALRWITAHWPVRSTAVLLRHVTAQWTSDCICPATPGSATSASPSAACVSSDRPYPCEGPCPGDHAHPRIQVPPTSASQRVSHAPSASPATPTAATTSTSTSTNTRTPTPTSAPSVAIAATTTLAPHVSLALASDPAASHLAVLPTSYKAAKAALLVHDLTMRWDPQAVADLIAIVVEEWSCHTQRRFFFKTLTISWDFGRLSYFLIALGERGRLEHKTKIGLLRDAAERERRLASLQSPAAQDASGLGVESASASTSRPLKRPFTPPSVSTHVDTLARSSAASTIRSATVTPSHLSTFGHTPSLGDNPSPDLAHTPPRTADHAGTSASDMLSSFAATAPPPGISSSQPLDGVHTAGNNVTAEAARIGRATNLRECLTRLPEASRSDSAISRTHSLAGMQQPPSSASARESVSDMDVDKDSNAGSNQLGSYQSHQQLHQQIQHPALRSSHPTSATPLQLRDLDLKGLDAQSRDFGAAARRLSLATACHESGMVDHIEDASEPSHMDTDQ